MHALFATVALAAVSLSSQAVQAASASCVVEVTAGSNSYSKKAVVKLGYDLAVYLCDEEHADAGEAYNYGADYSADVAEAYARAFVKTLINCNVQDGGSAYVSIKGHAETTAETTAEAILKGYAEASTCDGCDVYMNTYIKSVKSAFVKAVVDHEKELDLYAGKGESDHVYEDEVIEDIKHEIIDVIVSYYVELHAGIYKEGDSSGQYCYITASGCANTDEENCCDWNGDAGLNTEVKEALAEAFIEIPHEDVNCYYYGASDKVFKDFAKAVAYAWASAYASIYGYCSSENPSGNGCVWGGAAADAYANTAATAVARAWVDHSYCGCGGGDFVKKSLHEIFVNAYADISTKVCVEGIGSAELDVYADAFEEKYATAVASVFASVWKDEYSCKLTGEDGEPGPTLKACAGTASNHGVCYGSIVDGQKKCNDGWHCVKVHANRAVCKQVDWEPPSNWDGTILKCPEH